MASVPGKRRAAVAQCDATRLSETFGVVGTGVVLVEVAAADSRVEALAELTGVACETLTGKADTVRVRLYLDTPGGIAAGRWGAGRDCHCAVGTGESDGAKATRLPCFSVRVPQAVGDAEAAVVARVRPAGCRVEGGIADGMPVVA